MSHSAPAAFIARVVEGTTRTTVGTQNITFAGIGTVKGYALCAARVSAEDTFTQGYSVCRGFGDNSGRERCVSIWGQDNVLPSNCGTQGTRNASLRLLDPATGNPLVVANYAGQTTDGITLNYTQVEATAWKFFIVLFAGSQSSCYVGDEVPPTSGSTTVTTGIEQDFILTCCMPNVSETTSFDHAYWMNGVATRDDTDNFFNGFLAHDGEATTTSTRRISRNDSVAQDVTLSGAGTTSAGTTIINAHTSTGFNLTSGGGVGTAGPRIAFIAVQAGSATDVAVEAVGSTTGTATGNVSYVGPGHQTGFLALSFTAAQTQNAAATNGAGGWGVWDGRTECSICVTDENGAILSNTGMIYRSRIIDLYSHTQAELAEAATVSMDASGFTVNYSTAPAAARLLAFVSAQEMPLILHGDETVSVADTTILRKSALITQEPVSIGEGQFFVVAATKQDETIQISDQVKFVGVAKLVANESVAISDSMNAYLGRVLAVGETVSISDSFASAGVTRTRSTFFASAAIGGPEAGSCDMGGAKKGEVL